MAMITTSLDSKRILDTLGASIWPTLNYRLRGTDTLTWGDQNRWIEIKWIERLLSLLEGNPDEEFIKYVVLLDTAERGRLSLLRMFMHQLEEIYSLRHAAAVRRFLRAYPQLVEVLLEAHLYLQKHFGPDPQVTLEVVSDPEIDDADELIAYIRTPLPVDEVLERLNRLDEEWFLDQLDRVGGRFNFNVEFV